MKLLLAVLLALVVGFPAFAEDAIVRAALKQLDEAEKLLSGMKPGDKAAGQKVLSVIKAAKEKLARSSARGTEPWSAAVARADELAKSAQAKAVGEAVDLALGVQDKRNLDDFEANRAGWTKEIAAADPATLVPDGGPYRGCVAKLQAFLKAVKQQDHSAVREARVRLDEFEKLLAARIEEGKKAAAAGSAKAAAASQGADQELAQLAGAVEEKGFNAELQPPFTEERARAWVAALKSWKEADAKAVAALAQLVAGNPALAKDPRVGRLRSWYETMLPKALERGIDKTARSVTSAGSTSQGALPARVEVAKRLLAPGQVTGQRLQDERWVASSKKQAEEGIEAATALGIFRAGYEGKEDAGLAAAAGELRKLAAQLDAAAAQAAARPKPAPRPKAEAAPQAPGPEFDVWAGGSRWAQLTRDGRIWIGGSAVGELEADGKVWKGGSQVGSVESDGKIWKGGSQVGELERSGKLWRGGSQIATLDKGKIWLGGSVWGTAEGIKGYGELWRLAAVVAFFAPDFGY